MSNNFDMDKMQTISRVCKWFSECMLIKMFDRMDKRGVSWLDHTRREALNRIAEEVSELCRVLKDEPDFDNDTEIIHECVDIANQAMILADVVRRAHNVKAREKLPDKRSSVWRYRYDE